HACRASERFAARHGVAAGARANEPGDCTATVVRSAATIIYRAAAIACAGTATAAVERSAAVSSCAASAIRSAVAIRTSARAAISVFAIAGRSFACASAGPDADERRGVDGHAAQAAAEIDASA